MTLNSFDLSIIPPLIYLAAFIFGLYVCYKKKCPLYFRLLFFGVGCFFLEEIYYLTDYICIGNWSDSFSFACFGSGGCYAFMFSANYGLIDGIVDDGCSNSKAAKRTGRLAPIILALIFIVCSVYSYKTNGRLLPMVLMLISKFMAFPAAYFQLKHLVLKDNVDYILSYLKPCNAMGLAVIFIDFISDASYTFGFLPGIAVTEYLIPLSLLGLMIAADRGIKQWMI